MPFAPLSSPRDPTPIGTSTSAIDKPSRPNLATTFTSSGIPKPIINNNNFRQTSRASPSYQPPSPSSFPPFDFNHQPSNKPKFNPSYAPSTTLSNNGSQHERVGHRFSLGSGFGPGSGSGFGNRTRNSLGNGNGAGNRFGKDREPITPNPSGLGFGFGSGTNGDGGGRVQIQIHADEEEQDLMEQGDENNTNQWVYRSSSKGGDRMMLDGGRGASEVGGENRAGNETKIGLLGKGRNDSNGILSATTTTNGSNSTIKPSHSISQRQFGSGEVPAAAAPSATGGGGNQRLVLEEDPTFDEAPSNRTQSQQPLSSSFPHRRQSAVTASGQARHVLGVLSEVGSTDVSANGGGGRDPSFSRQNGQQQQVNGILTTTATATGTGTKIPPGQGAVRERAKNFELAAKALFPSSSNLNLNSVGDGHGHQLGTTAGKRINGTGNGTVGGRSRARSRASIATSSMPAQQTLAPPFNPTNQHQSFTTQIVPSKRPSPPSQDPSNWETPLPASDYPSKRMRHSYPVGSRQGGATTAAAALALNNTISVDSSLADATQSQLPPEVLRETICRLRARVLALTSSEANLKDQLSGLQAQETALQNALQSRRERDNQTMGELEAGLGGLREEIDKEKQAKDEKEKELKKLGKMQRGLENRLNKAEDDLNETREREAELLITLERYEQDKLKREQEEEEGHDNTKINVDLVPWQEALKKSRTMEKKLKGELEVRRCEERLERSEWEGDERRWRKDKVEARYDYAMLNFDYKALEIAKEEVEEQVESLEDEIHELKGRLDDLNSQNALAVSECSEQRAMATTASQSLARLEESFLELEAERDALLEEQQGLEEIREEFDQQQMKWESEMESMREEMAIKDETIREVHETMVGDQARMKELSSKVQGLERTVKEKERELKLSDNEARGLRKELETAREELEAALADGGSKEQLKEKEKEFKKERDKWNKDKERCERETEELQLQLKGWRGRGDRWQRERDDWDEERRGWEEEVEGLRAKLRSVNAHWRASRAETAELQANATLAAPDTASVLRSANMTIHPIPSTSAAPDSPRFSQTTMGMRAQSAPQEDQEDSDGTVIRKPSKAKRTGAKGKGKATEGKKPRAARSKKPSRAPSRAAEEEEESEVEAPTRPRISSTIPIDYDAHELERTQSLAKGMLNLDSRDPRVGRASSTALPKPFTGEDPSQDLLTVPNPARSRKPRAAAVKATRAFEVSGDDEGEEAQEIDVHSNQSRARSRKPSNGALREKVVNKNGARAKSTVADEDEDEDEDEGGSVTTVKASVIGKKKSSKTIEAGTEKRKNTAGENEGDAKKKKKRLFGGSQGGGPQSFTNLGVDPTTTNLYGLASALSPIKPSKSVGGMSALGVGKQGVGRRVFSGF